VKGIEIHYSCILIVVVVSSSFSWLSLLSLDDICVHMFSYIYIYIK